jgi:hypothetical protein
MSRLRFAPLDMTERQRKKEGGEIRLAALPPTNDGLDCFLLRFSQFARTSETLRHCEPLGYARDRLREAIQNLDNKHTIKFSSLVVKRPAYLHGACTERGEAIFHIHFFIFLTEKYYFCNRTGFERLSKIFRAFQNCPEKRKKVFFKT